MSYYKQYIVYLKLFIFKKGRLLASALDRYWIFFYICSCKSNVIQLSLDACMDTKKTALPQILQDFRREDDNETTEVHIIESDVWYT